ncbi:FAD/NAD(P)-binding protein [Commensalibacter melissae]|uniref:FAD/NAD(P)-binding protein n=1 Tax=Commensalibacter melissae TaxID=2070537 RepID=UPI0012D89ED1|nr:FAD/NAD(P)-binding protein [Commensalibacter melissae]MUH07050.1 response regulator [Commensalibacter melissae]
MNNDYNKIKISIIGLGSRGLNVLERIISHCIWDEKLKDRQIILQLFNENKDYGAGCHDINQSENLLVNTICSQITVFPDDTVKNYKYAIRGPTFYEWLKIKYKSQDKTINPLNYYSRKDLGEYLCWVFNYLCSIKVQNLQIIKIQEKVINISGSDKKKWSIVTKNNTYSSDIICITTGHDTQNCEFPNKKKIYAYPLEKLDHIITNKETVAIQGLGLTTFDVISKLTEDRGGKFIKEKDHLIYQPSGKEPKIIAFSRSGLPLNARGRTQKELREQYKPQIFTKEKIIELKNNKKIDFEKDYLPLLIEEMECVYSFTYLKNQDIIKAYNFLNDYLRNKSQRNAIVKAYIPDEKERFSWEKISDPLAHTSFKSQEEFHDWLLNYLQEDIHNALQGNIDNPTKASTDILRDVRDWIRLTVDHCGLSEKSAIWFNEVFKPIMIRICVGPPLERIQQMIALIKANILRIDLGPNVKVEEKKESFYLTTQFNEVMRADYYIVAMVNAPIAKESKDILFQNILKNNIGCQFHIGNYALGEFNVNTNFNLINQNNQIIKSIYALGVPTEGSKFYTYILPRPFVNSTALFDAEVCTNNLLSQIAR